MNLLALIEGLAVADNAPAGVVLETERCLHRRDKASECDACFRVCPVMAIQPGRPPTLDQERCIRCRACLPLCPVDAYQAADELAPLFKQAVRLEGKALELVCGPHPNPEQGPAATDQAIFTRGCLAGLGSGAYLALAALGPAHLLLRTDACAGCPLGDLQEQIERQATTAQQALAAWPQAAAIQCSGPLAPETLVNRPVQPADRLPLSRRELFRLTARPTDSLPAWVNGDEDEAGQKAPPASHRLIIAALTHLGRPDPERPAPTLNGLGLATIIVDAGQCTACGVCARACPTGALHFAEDAVENAFQLSLTPPDCIGCAVCAHVCLPEAITLNRRPSWEQIMTGAGPMTLLAGPLVSCERCGAKFAAKEEEARYCSICEMRRQNPFASILPPAFERQMAAKTEPGPL